jgi:hypothetical protein
MQALDVFEEIRGLSASQMNWKSMGVAGGRDVHFASLRREISMNCLMSFISVGIVGSRDEGGSGGLGRSVPIGKAVYIERSLFVPVRCELSLRAIKLGLGQLKPLSTTYVASWGACGRRCQDIFL